MFAKTTKRMPLWPSIVVAVLLVSWFGTWTRADEPTALEAAMILEKSLTDAIARAEKSVVAIARIRLDPLQPGELRLGDDVNGLLPSFNATESDPTSPDFVPNEYGSGVVVDSKGLILTNYHVLGNVKQNRYYVWSDRRPFRAEVLAADPMMDLAVLKVDADSLTPIVMANNTRLRKGQIVITLGNPHAIARDGEPSATWGIISNLTRRAPVVAERGVAPKSRPTLHHFGTLIQTDAKLNFGTSGGALINLKGEMIGLTTSLTASAGAREAAGFAIPVDDVFRRTVEKLKRGEAAEFGFLGVRPEPLDEQERQKGRFGAVIQSVVLGTPAARAGLRNGDIVTHVEGETVHDDSDLFRLLSSYPVNKEVRLTVRRRTFGFQSGRKLTLTAMLSKKYVSGVRPTIARTERPSWRGAAIDYATAIPPEQLQQRIGYLDAKGCVAVVAIEPDSPAWNSGLREGAFISQIENRQVTTPSEFYTIMGTIDGDVRLSVTGSNGRLETVVVAAAEADPAVTSP